MRAAQIQGGSRRGGAGHRQRARPLGGDAVDSWVLRDVCSRMDYPIEEWADDEEDRFWRRMMLAEACR